MYTAIENRLYAVNRQRNRYAYIPNILLIVASTYFNRKELLESYTWWLPPLLVVLGLCMRVIVTEVIYEKWKQGVFWVRGLNMLAFLVLVSGWITHFYEIYESYGGGSRETANTLIFIAGLVAGSTISLASHRPTYFLYTTGMCGAASLIFLMDPEQPDKSVVAYISVFYFFNVFNMLAAHKQLRRSIENELRLEKETLRIKGIIDTVPGLVWIVDKNFMVTLANKMTLSLFPGVHGKKLGEIDSNSKWEQDVISFMSSGKMTTIMEEHTRDHNGNNLWLLLTVQKSGDEGAILIALKTNELMEAKEKLKEQEAKAQFSGKLASLGEMAAGIAHEVNNPLTIIQGSACIIEKLVTTDPIDKVTVIQLAKKVSETSERISKIIKSLKRLSRSGDKDPLAPVNLEAMIGHTLDICGQMAKNYSIELRLPSFESPVTFSGREVQLGQVLLNLISNAIDAVKDYEVKWIELGYKKTSSNIEIYVTDSGPGVPTEIADKIMEPFFTTKEINQGTGLGLSISQTIMKEHGGELFLDTSCKHTTFKMVLPLHPLQ